MFVWGSLWFWVFFFPRTSYEWYPGEPERIIIKKQLLYKQYLRCMCVNSHRLLTWWINRFLYISISISNLYLYLSFFILALKQKSTLNLIYLCRLLGPCIIRVDGSWWIWSLIFTSFEICKLNSILRLSFPQIVQHSELPSKQMSSTVQILSDFSVINEPFTFKL